MKKVINAVIVLILAGAVFAADNTVECTVKGQGPTREKAIQNGLYLAVCKVQGVAVSSDIATVNVQTGNLDVIRDPETGSRKISLENISARSAGTLTLTEAKGLVKSFDITEETQVSPDVYEVSMKVLVLDYQSPEDTKKIRLAVMPLDTAAGAYRFGDVSIPGRRLSDQFNQYLCTMLARSEKFTVLDRNTQSAILKEKNILSSDDAPLDEKVRLGEALGADYMLVGAVPQAELTVEEKDNPAVGMKTRRFRAYMQVEYRLIVGPTRQVAASDQLRIKLKDQQVKDLAEKWESDNIDYNELEQKLVERAAGQMADMVAEYLYPVSVAAVQEGGTVILNQGGRRFAEGDILEVDRLGGDITDPQTGKSLGREQTTVATIKVTRVLPRITYASVTGGGATKELVGGICKRAKPDAEKPLSRPSGSTQTSGGGVKLPFDDRGQPKIIKDK